MTIDTISGDGLPKAVSGQDIVSVAEVRVDTKIVHYTVGGTGPTVLFLHGWGLGHHAYRGGLRRLAQIGFHVVAPALPGFGGTPDLEPGNRTFVGYARWLTRFVKATGITPMIIVGHSFGGGVGIRVMADNPGYAQALVLINSVGGAWRTDGGSEKPMAERPMWDWGRAIPADVNVISNYSAVITKEAPSALAARALLDFVASDAGQAILAEYGFLAP